MERRPKYEQAKDLDEIAAKLGSVISERLIPIKSISDREFPIYMIVDRQKAYSYGVSAEGIVPDLDDSQLDELFGGSIDPSLN